MEIRAVNRLNGKTIIAKLRERAKVRVTPKKREPMINNVRNVA